jgi:heme/copper-type cytochrome/quinol oxidase subunit 3
MAAAVTITDRPPDQSQERLVSVTTLPISEAHRRGPPLPTIQVAPNGVVGMLIFIVSELMLFAGFVSAVAIVRTRSGDWPPPGQPRLPAGETAINTLALMASGALLYYAGKKFLEDPRTALKPMRIGIGLAGFFLVFQGAEWVAMLRQGLTLSSSPMGSFFYLIVGLHGLHALGAVTAMIWAERRLSAGRLTHTEFWTARLFWYFVVLVWPVLYWRLYL